MRNTFKTGCFGNRGLKGIIRGMGRNGVKHYRRNKKNIVNQPMTSPQNSQNIWPEIIAAGIIVAVVVLFH